MHKHNSDVLSRVVPLFSIVNCSLRDLLSPFCRFSSRDLPSEYSHAFIFFFPPSPLVSSFSAPFLREDAPGAFQTFLVSQFSNIQLSSTQRLPQEAGVPLLNS